MHARLVLARVATIAIRYTSLRRQFKNKESNCSDEEIAVLDYSTVQIRLIPLLAGAFALHYTGLKMKEIFDDARESIDKGDFSGLLELHAISSGLKSFCTDLAAGGIEIGRRAMGGHGFGGYSGLVQLNSDYLSKPTVEGDNWMITQQLSRYLLQAAGDVILQPRKLTNSSTNQILTRYWNTKDRDVRFNLKESRAIVDIFARRAAYSVSSMRRPDTRTSVNRKDF